ncbi:MAG: HEAT repeat domain-containing protein [Planctomycetia bacterium]|jgi:HEAT repeat protein
MPSLKISYLVLLLVLTLAVLGRAAPFYVSEPMSLDEMVRSLDDKDPKVVAEAVRQLGNQKDLDDKTLDRLALLLGDQRSTHGFMLVARPVTVADCAADTLVEIGTKSVVAPVCKFLASAKEPEDKSMAIQTLGRLGPAASTVLDRLTPYLKDKDEHLRIDAIWAVASVSTDANKTVNLLLPMLNDKKSDVKSAAIRAFGNLGPKAKEAVPHITTFLDSVEARSYFLTSDMVGMKLLCTDAAWALGEIGAPAKSSLPKLAKMLDHKDREVRVAAALAHCQISGRRKPGLDALLKELDAKDNASGDTVFALIQIKKAHKDLAAPILKGVRKALKHPSPNIRLHAIWAMDEFSPPDLVSSLTPLLKDPHGVVRDSIIRTLSPHAAKHPELQPAFIEYLKKEHIDEDKEGGWERVTAVKALGRIGTPSAEVITLLEDLSKNDGESLVQTAARNALKKLKNSQGKQTR